MSGSCYASTGHTDLEQELKPTGGSVQREMREHEASVAHER